MTSEAKVQGIEVKRYFTKEGIHPYDEVEWSKYDAVIKNYETGEIKFEQRAVEFPTFYSVNAINIITSKYFKGQIGTEDREWEHKSIWDFNQSVS